MKRRKTEPERWHHPPPIDLLICLLNTAPGHPVAWKYLANVRSWLGVAWEQQRAEFNRHYVRRNA